MKGGCYLQLPDGTLVESDEYGVPLNPSPAATAETKPQSEATLADTETATAVSGEESE
jgi:hypothetical protein